MAKQRTVLPARKPRDRSRDDSLLLRSAESLGRVIGALQRQLDGATKRLSEADSDAIARRISSRQASGEAKGGSGKRGKAKAKKSAKSGSRTRAAPKTTRRR